MGKQQQEIRLISTQSPLGAVGTKHCALRGTSHTPSSSFANFNPIVEISQRMKQQVRTEFGERPGLRGLRTRLEMAALDKEQ